MVMPISATRINRFWCCVQLRSSRFIDAERLLKVIPHNSLLEVQALLHKHLGDHKEALRLRVSALFIIALSWQRSGYWCPALSPLHCPDSSQVIGLMLLLICTVLAALICVSNEA